MLVHFGNMYQQKLRLVLVWVILPCSLYMLFYSRKITCHLFLLTEFSNLALNVVLMGKLDSIIHE